MGLPSAMRAHRDKDYPLALKHYQRALDQGVYEPVLFQNYGSLLRETGKPDIAKNIYQKGLSLFPKDEGIRQNFANLIRSSSPWAALDLYLSILFDCWETNLRSKHFLAVVEVLESQGSILWAYQICKLAFEYVSVQPSLLVLFYKLAIHSDNSYLDSIQRNELTEMIDKLLVDANPLDRAEYFYAVSWIHLNKHDVELAHVYLNRARTVLGNSTLPSVQEHEKADGLNNRSSWNMACVLLKFQHFSDGWDFFDYGLRTEAPGSQKWQRALPKPFTFEQITLWRGEDLTESTLLLLEEQAIGDVMQFITLLPTLLSEVKHVGILISNRLIPIYRRSLNSFITQHRLSIWSFDDVLHSRLNPDDYDYQSPIGSICRYRFKDIKRYGLYSPVLVCDDMQSLELRNKYISLSNHKKKLVGISWRGGGTSDRIKQKSIDFNKLLFLLKVPDICFISLQYGEAESTVNKLKENGVDILFDSSVNALKDMDRWLSQVGACDAVISVANTTIHGSGGLNIPTQCLLSKHSDWRWLSDSSIRRSYWYPSVGICRESNDNGWNDALGEVKDWLLEGMPMPSGRIVI